MTQARQDLDKVVLFHTDDEEFEPVTEERWSITIMKDKMTAKMQRLQKIYLKLKEG